VNPRALIAEDEPLLAASLATELKRTWPELAIAATVGDGQSAVKSALALSPEVAFFDIRMPGMSGLEAARALAEDWPEDGAPFPLIVFVTAYDQYALEAFDRAAFDYVLKPVQPARLAQTCERLRQALQGRGAEANGSGGELGRVVEQLRGLLGASALAMGVPPPSGQLLQVIQAGSGNAIHMVPIGDVLYFEAADKYVRVITAVREHLIRTALRELLPMLDASHFWQIHRGTVVRADAIGSVLRDEAGKVTLTLRGRPEKLVVSRLYTHLFKAM